MSADRFTARSDASANGEPSPENEIGRFLRRRRLASKLTLADLAAKTSLSVSFLSQVERGRANPTLARLKTLASALDTTVGALMGESVVPSDDGDESLVSVTRPGQRRRVVYPGSSIANELLSPNLQVGMEVIWVEAPPGSGSGGHPHSHSGEECGIVLSGTMQFWVGDEEWMLGPRDSIYFPSELPHRWLNPADDDLVAVWIITPPTF